MSTCKALYRPIFLGTAIMMLCMLWTVPLGASASVAGQNTEYLLARQALNTYDISRAKKFYREALKNDPSSLFLLNKLVVLESQGGTFGALYALTKVLLRKDPTNPQALFALGILLLHDGRFKRAMGLFKKGQEGAANGSSQKHLFHMAWLWASLAEGRDDRVEVFLQQTEQQWIPPNMLFVRGLMVSFLKKPQAIQKTYEKILSTLKNPQQKRLAQGLYAYALESSDPRKARALFRDVYPFSSWDGYRAMQKVPRFFAFSSRNQRLEGLLKHFSLSLLVFALDAYEKDRLIPALKNNLPSSKIKTFDALSLVQFALFLTNQSGRSSQADRAHFWMLLGTIKTQQGYPMEGEHIYRKISQETPPFIDAQRALIAIFVQEQDHEALFALLNRLQIAFPSKTIAWNMTGEVYQMLNDPTRALQAYKKATERCEDFCWTLEFKVASLLYDQRAPWRETQGLLLKIVEESRRAPIVLNFLGYGMLQHGDNSYEAIALIKEAYQKNKSAFILDSLGWGYYCLQDYVRSSKHLSYASMLQPGSWEIDDHLGDSFWRSGYPVQARYQWRNALEQHPPEEKKASLAQKILTGLTSKNTCAP